MRHGCLPAVLFVAGCSFQGANNVNPPGEDARITPPVDGPRPDGPRPDSQPDLARRKQLTIDPARVDGNHTDFPVWIVIDNDGDLKTRPAQSGNDLHFTRPDGMPLPYEIRRWDKAAGDLEAWVRVDLQDNVATVIELRYGDPADAHPPDPPAVFSNSYAAVWHLDDAVGGGNTAIADARNQRAGTAFGLEGGDQIAGKLGGAIDFDGTSERIEFQNPYAAAGSHTISVWIDARLGTDYDSIVTVGTAAPSQSRWFHARFLNGLSAGFYSNDHPGSLVEIHNDSWILLHWVWNGANGRSRVYRNGVQVGGDGTFAGINTQGNAGYIGYAPGDWGPGGNTTCGLAGALDELRLATVVRDVGWLTTEFANQSSPQTFYTVGAEQTVP